MATRSRRPERRQEPLSRERIVGAAVELLDTVGERGLTFRALAERLATGPGAIYWHITGKAELLGAATDAVVTAAVTAGPTDAADSPEDAVRAVALGLWDATEAHPWLAAQLATQLSRTPWGTVAPRIFESLGRQVQAMGVPEAHWFTASSALMHYILGAAGQNAANSASAGPAGADVDRDEFLDTVSTAWEGLDPDAYPFTRAVADQVRGHDDREQFLAGITLVLTGITALHRPGR
ncbi:TetR/AcrR family transcriptional regulator [Streptomyces rubrogriseus]|uniref:TetR family transcriptional regulator n=1 Tax=Streptomyces rubrogriseus TaxID=194673 RepID=A0A6G3TGF4_9ACTN|nr:TetR/AcrR family transcriptional regulator [Streptomyces rubrogriseus]NEC35673.1 TetR family transcriptional regulator [Streptomyces rubrogriseus]